MCCNIIFARNPGFSVMFNRMYQTFKVSHCRHSLECNKCFRSRQFAGLSLEVVCLTCWLLTCTDEKLHDQYQCAGSGPHRIRLAYVHGKCDL